MYRSGRPESERSIHAYPQQQRCPGSPRYHQPTQQHDDYHGNLDFSTNLPELGELGQQQQQIHHDPDHLGQEMPLGSWSGVPDDQWISAQTPYFLADMTPLDAFAGFLEVSDSPTVEDGHCPSLQLHETNSETQQQQPEAPSSVPAQTESVSGPVDPIHFPHPPLLPVAPGPIGSSSSWLADVYALDDEHAPWSAAAAAAFGLANLEPAPASPKPAERPPSPSPPRPVKGSEASSSLLPALAPAPASPTAQPPPPPPARPIKQRPLPRPSKKEPNATATTTAPTTTTTTGTERRWKCKESICRKSLGFKRKPDLIRHINSVHARDAARKMDCPAPKCTRKGRSGFTRKDHLTEHLRNYHVWKIPKRKGPTAKS